MGLRHLRDNSSHCWHNAKFFSSATTKYSEMRTPTPIETIFEKKRFSIEPFRPVRKTVRRDQDDNGRPPWCVSPRRDSRILTAAGCKENRVSFLGDTHNFFLYSLYVYHVMVHPQDKRKLWLSEEFTESMALERQLQQVQASKDVPLLYSHHSMHMRVCGGFYLYSCVCTCLFLKTCHI